MNNIMEKIKEILIRTWNKNMFLKVAQQDKTVNLLIEKMTYILNFT